MSETNILQRGVLLDAASLDANDMDFSGLRAEISEFTARSLTSASELRDVLPDMHLVITNKVRLDRQALQNNPQLRLICVTATGTNNVDLVAARELGIAVCNVRAYATPSVVQHVFALMLSMTARLTEIQAAINAGEWSRSPHFSLLHYPIQELAGKTLGIIGYGELGQAVARVAECFGMRILVAQNNKSDRRAGRLPLQDLLPQVDVLSIHCPLTDETVNLIGDAELKLMKSSALLINTARGGIVNEQALLHALQNRSIAGAALDVLSIEPPPENHILMQYKQPNLIITPHVAWASRESRQRCLNEVVLNVVAFKRGELRNRV
ncbi:MAG: D-2-hydroxyacid dehydrogenase [Gammaproteobacteria bacterium]|jgi:glycerate dehydrogenase|nr:D-2-hydroxyacid dehydrogenase [Gammaproteobacteria bacterium]